MLRTNQIGKTRMRLAEILTGYCGVYVAPAFLLKNYSDYRNGRNFGYAFSWSFETRDKNHPLYNCGSGLTMADFVRWYTKGYKITRREGELFIEKG